MAIYYIIQDLNFKCNFKSKTVNVILIIVIKMYVRCVAYAISAILYIVLHLESKYMKVLFPWRW